MIRAGIIGSTGYAGGELVRILLGHKDVEIKNHASGSSRHGSVVNESD